MSKLMRFLGWTAAVLVVLGVIGRLTVLDVWKIPEGTRLGISLEPTLSEGDTVIMLTRGKPGFGDLVRCTDPQDPTGFVVGRISGLSGDTIEVHGPDLRVGGKRYTGEMACAGEPKELVHPVSGEKIRLGCDQVQMGGRLHYRGFSQKEHALEDRKTATVGSGMVFLLSDDRSYHDDSRDFGTVPLESCRHRMILRLWSKQGWMDDAARLSYIH